MIPTFDEIALAYNTDKSSKYHGYTRIYEEEFGHLRKSPISILEIGVFEGASMRMWLDAFPLANVVGVDIRDRTGGKCKHERLSLKFADASKQSTYDEIVAEHGPFNIVIEDGPHRLAVSKMCLDNLPTLLMPGGTMVIEDVYQGYVNAANRDMQDFLSYATMVGHGGGKVKGVMAGNWDMATPLAKLVDGVEHRRGLVIVRRRP